jgi:hypothetical protein
MRCGARGALPPCAPDPAIASDAGVVCIGQRANTQSLDSLTQLPTVPLPAYPVLHLQLKPPMVLVQVARGSQGLGPVVHSSTSGERWAFVQR